MVLKMLSFRSVKKQFQRIRNSNPAESASVFFQNLPGLSHEDTVTVMGRKRLNQALDLEEYNDNQFLRSSLYILGASALIFFPWAALTPITQVVEASGEVVPRGSVSIIQHLDGGIVSSVMVKNGQSVKQGDVLLTINPKIVDSEYAATQARIDALLLQQDRLSAAINGKSKLSLSFTDAELISKDPKVALAQQRLLSVTQSNTKDQIKTAQAVILEKQAEVDGLIRQLREFKKQRDMWATLVEDGASSKLQLSSAQAKVEEVTGARNEAIKALAQSKSNLNSLRSGLALEQSSLIASLVNEESIVSENIKKVRFQLDRTNIKAPVSGKVSDLRFFTSGSVIAPGAVVASVVPEGTAKLVEARIPANDIASVQVGQNVDINILPYDSMLYGSIPGKVLRISGDSIQNPDDNRFYYLATIKLIRQFVDSSENAYPVQVGMPVVADIKGQQSNLLRYLFQPFLRTLNGSFRE